MRIIDKAQLFLGGGGGRFQIAYIFVLRVGKKPTFHEKVVETLARNTNIDFPIKFRDQTLKFY